MRLIVDHRTTYRFTAPQSRLIQLLRVNPEDTHDQSVASWTVHVDCDARFRPGRDGFGNSTTMLYVDGPIDGIEITVSGEVLTNPSRGIVHGGEETLPPELFLRATALTAADQAIWDFAHTIGDGVQLATLHALNGTIHQRFALDRGRPITGQTAATAFQRETATPRDLTHIFVAAARCLGIPARYVSGYSPVCFGADSSPAPHGWAEAYVEDLGWVAFDPCTGLSADEAYVRVAVALDAAGAAPVAGSRLGEGEERLDVDLHVDRAGH